jgi:hypothetical protein
MIRGGPAVAMLLAAISSVPVAGCGDDTDAGPDPRCCDYLYPVWCARFAECDPVTFSRSWRDPAACEAQQIAACRGGTDPEALCTGRSEGSTDACAAALRDAICDDLFGAAGLPAACDLP